MPRFMLPIDCPLTMSAPFRFVCYNPAEIKVFSQALCVQGAHCHESLEIVTIRPTIVTTTTRAGAAQSRGSTEPGQHRAEQHRAEQHRIRTIQIWGNTEPSNIEPGQHRSGATQSRATKNQDNTDPGQHRAGTRKNQGKEPGQYR